MYKEHIETIERLLSRLTADNLEYPALRTAVRALELAAACEPKDQAAELAHCKLAAEEHSQDVFMAAHGDVAANEMLVYMQRGLVRGEVAAKYAGIVAAVKAVLAADDWSDNFVTNTLTDALNELEGK